MDGIGGILSMVSQVAGIFGGLSGGGSGQAGGGNPLGSFLGGGGDNIQQGGGSGNSTMKTIGEIAQIAGLVAMFV